MLTLADHVAVRRRHFADPGAWDWWLACFCAGLEETRGDHLLSLALADDAGEDVRRFAFCPTGEGGGVDPSCEGGGGGSGQSPRVTSWPDGYAEEFTAPSGITYRVMATRGESRGWLGGKRESWEVMFGATGPDGDLTEKATGREGAGAVGVLRKVGEAIDRFVKEKGPREFTFAASRWERSRVALYDRAAKMVAARNGYALRRRGGLAEITYQFTRRDVPATEHADPRRFAFCPTGEGGGVDPSCGPGDHAGGLKDASPNADGKTRSAAAAYAAAENRVWGRAWHVLERPDTADFAAPARVAAEKHVEAALEARGKPFVKSYQTDPHGKGELDGVTLFWSGGKQVAAVRNAATDYGLGHGSAGVFVERASGKRLRIEPTDDPATAQAKVARVLGVKPKAGA